MQSDLTNVGSCASEPQVEMPLRFHGECLRMSLKMGIDIALTAHIDNPLASTGELLKIAYRKAGLMAESIVATPEGALSQKQ